jgi:adenine-specific DNA-methyltransferase
MPRGKNGGVKPPKRPITQYEHRDKKRINNPPVGLVTPDTDPPLPTHKTYDHVQPVPTVRPANDLDYDPHLDPQLVWAGKKEHTSFEVPTVSLHVHERIDPHTIVESVLKRNGNTVQPSLFERREENPPLREAVDFYRHSHGWSNRFIAGDSLLVMNSLLEKEGMAGQVQMVYIDPPYGIEYKSNFQPFVNKRRVDDRKDEDLTQEPEMVKAFRDTWTLGVHSFLSYLRDRILLARDLLHETGSIFVQISDENVHRTRSILDELLGNDNFVAQINFKTMMPLESGHIESVYDYLCWYAKDIKKLKYRNLFVPKVTGEGAEFVFCDSEDGYRRLTREELREFEETAKNLKIFKRSDLASSGYTPSCTFPLEFNGETYTTSGGKSWRTTPEGIEKLKQANRLFVLGKKIYFKMYLDDFGYGSLTNSWHDTIEFGKRIFVVQTTPTVIERCLLMTTDPGDLVLDPTCGSGTTAYVAEQWGRRWITCDTSRVAITLAKQRLMTEDFKYYELAHPDEGVGSGLRYRTVPHVTLKSIANNPEIHDRMTREQIDAVIGRYADQETLFDQPYLDKSRVRVTGPFTVEAVPAPTVRSLDEIPSPEMSEGQESLAVFRHASTPSIDATVSRSGPTLRHTEWRDELLKTGLRGKGGHHIDFSRVEPLAGTRWLHADAETKGVKPERVVISFGPEHSLLEQRQVELAWEEARTLSPRPSILVFAAFEFDPEAAKDIDGMTKEKTGMTFLTAQMNADLLTEDLKKKRASNQSFWLVGRPDVDLREIATGQHKGKWQVEVRGFDYYNTRTGTIESGDTSRIAMWLFDPDYDGRSLFPRQVFFPMANDGEGWSRLAKNLKAEIDSELIESYRGTVSLPFEPGPHKRVAVKVVDDRGIESLKVVEVR